MKDLLALKHLLIVLVLFGMVMSALALVAGHDAVKYIIPSPEMTAEQFLVALKAERYNSAHDLLASDLQQQVTIDRLRNWHATLQAHQQQIFQANGESSEVAADHAEALVKLKMENHELHYLHFQLKKEHGEWKVSSLDAVDHLLAQF